MTGWRDAVAAGWAQHIVVVDDPQPYEEEAHDPIPVMAPAPDPLPVCDVCGASLWPRPDKGWVHLGVRS